MPTDVTYTVDEARRLLPEIRSALLGVAIERRRPQPSLDVVEALLRHLDARGIVVRDLDEGLIDVPTLRDGEPAWLCWKLSDGELGYWHTTREGFASRRPL